MFSKSATWNFVSLSKLICGPRLVWTFGQSKSEYTKSTKMPASLTALRLGKGDRREANFATFRRDEQEQLEL